MPSSTRPPNISGWGYMHCGGPAWWRWWRRRDVLELLGREEGDIETWRWCFLVPGNLCKAASLHPSWARRKSWKQQGTMKGGCNLAGVPLRCTPPWPSVRLVIVDRFFPWALAHLIPDILHSPMAGEEVVERLSVGRIRLWRGRNRWVC